MDNRGKVFLQLINQECFIQSAFDERTIKKVWKKQGGINQIQREKKYIRRLQDLEYFYESDS